MNRLQYLVDGHYIDNGTDTVEVKLISFNGEERTGPVPRGTLRPDLPVAQVGRLPALVVVGVVVTCGNGVLPITSCGRAAAHDGIFVCRWRCPLLATLHMLSVASSASFCPYDLTSPLCESLPPCANVLEVHEIAVTSTSPSFYRLPAHPSSLLCPSKSGGSRACYCLSLCSPFSFPFLNPSFLLIPSSPSPPPPPHVPTQRRSRSSPSQPFQSKPASEE